MSYRDGGDARMKVLLCNPPRLDNPGHYMVVAGSRWPHYQPLGGRYMPFPFFLAYAAAVLERAEIDVKLIDAVAERINNDEFMAQVKEYSPNVIIIETSTPSIDIDLDWAKKLNSQHPEAEIVFCGTHAEMFEPAWLEKHICVD